MRPALLTSLLVIGLLAIGLRAQTRPGVGKKTARAPVQVQLPAAPKSAEAPPPAALSDREPPFIIKGALHSNVEDAQNDALEKAWIKVATYLRSQDPPVQWPLPLEYVQRRLVKKRDLESDERLEGNPDLSTMRRVVLEVDLTPEDRQDILRHDREYRMWARMAVLAKLLGGLVLALAAVAGYVRLDEYTKGYYTAWLRVAAVALLVAGVGLLLL